MSFTSHEIAFLRDLVAKGSGQKAASSTSKGLNLHYGMGQHVGSRFLFTETDAAKARQMLTNASIPLAPPAVALRRADAAMSNPAQEKSGTLAPHHNSIAVKAAHGRCDLEGHPIASQGYQVLTLEQALKVRVDALLIVENLESLRFLERNRWIDYQGQAVLAVFRGDGVFRADVVAQLMEGSSTTVWSYFDFDPAGLGMTAKLPRLQRILLPPKAVLTSAARKANQVHLYADQAGQWSKSLMCDSRPMVQQPWELLRQLRLGLAQELMDLL